MTDKASSGSQQPGEPFLNRMMSERQCLSKIGKYAFPWAPAHVEKLSAQDISSLAVRGRKMSSCLNLEHCQSSANRTTTSSVVEDVHW